MTYTVMGIMHVVVVRIILCDNRFPRKYIGNSPANEHLFCIKDMWS